MKFSLLMDILNKADMVTEVAIQEDCEVADLNLMDRECQQMYNQTVYFIRAEEIGPTTKLPACLIYQGKRTCSTGPKFEKAFLWQKCSGM